MKTAATTTDSSAFSRASGYVLIAGLLPALLLTLTTQRTGRHATFNLSKHHRRLYLC